MTTVVTEGSTDDYMLVTEGSTDDYTSHWGLHCTAM